MTNTIYDIGLDRNAANFQPLTPLSFLERAAAVFPQRSAIVHGASTWTYLQTCGLDAALRRLKRSEPGPSVDVDPAHHGEPPAALGIVMRRIFRPIWVRRWPGFPYYPISGAGSVALTRGIMTE